MHDLIHDLARFVSRNFCLTLDIEGLDKISKRTRHVSYIGQEFDASRRFDPLLKTQKLRTFLKVSMSSYFLCNYLADKVLHELLPTFECLRALSLCHYHITHLHPSFETFEAYEPFSYCNIKVTSMDMYAFEFAIISVVILP